MVIQFIHLILLCYGVTDFAGSFASMPHLSAVLWIFISMIILFRWLPGYAYSNIKTGCVPQFSKTYNIFCFIIVLWISLFFAAVDPVSSVKLSDIFSSVTAEKSVSFSMILAMVLYLLFLRPFMFYLYEMLRPVLPDDQSAYDFIRARMTVPIIFFPPIILWSLLEDFGFNSGMELLTELKSLILAPAFLIFLFLLAPKLLSWAWRAEDGDSELNTRINELCKQAGTKIAGVKVWNTFKEPLLNAAVSGLLGCFRFVFITDYLLKTFKYDEVESVVAHELGHFKLGHVFTYMIFSLVAILSAILIKCYSVFCFPYFYVHSTLSYIIEIVLFVPVFAICFTAMTRFCERQADAFSVSLTSRESFCLALSFIESVSTKESKWLPGWLRTHPKTSERINNVKNNEVYKISSLIRAAKVLRYILLVVAIVLFLLSIRPISIVLQWSNLYNAAQAGNCDLVTDLCNSLPEWLQEHPFVLEQKEKVTAKSNNKVE